MAEHKTVIVHKKQHRAYALLAEGRLGGANFVVASTVMYDFLEEYDDCVLSVIALTVEDADMVIKYMGTGKARGSVTALDIPDKLVWLLRVPLLGKYYLNRKRASAELYAFFGK